MRRDKQWNRLDNAAKIFPPTTSRQDTKVFRFVCQLKEPVDSAVLQKALERTMVEFPLYRSVLKKGFFWYYFEESSLEPRVSEESLPICAPIYNADTPGLPFRVSYYKRRINLEIFHALADGTGALQFLRSMVFTYLSILHRIKGRLEDYEADPEQKNQDAFYQYYDGTGHDSRAGKRHRAYRIRGERLADHQLSVTEGFLSTEAVLKTARDYGATLSEFLIAVMICSICEGMAVRESARPVVITVPVDLRRHFPAQTARNFFGVIKITYDTRKDGREFESVLARVKQSFQEQLTRENLREIIRHYSSIENNAAIKVIPLQIKIPFLRLAGWRADGEDTAAFSNVGRVVMPPEAAKHITLFDVFLSTKRPQICLCSFGDTLAVSVSSPLRSTGLQRRFFRMLTRMDLKVEVVSNMEQISEEN